MPATIPQAREVVAAVFNQWKNNDMRADSPAILEAIDRAIAAAFTEGAKYAMAYAKTNPESRLFL